MDSYGNIRYPFGSSRKSNTVELIHDAFQDLSYWNGFMTSGFEGVAIDTHIYTIFSNAVRVIQPFNDCFTVLIFDHRRLP